MDVKINIATSETIAKVLPLLNEANRHFADLANATRREPAYNPAFSEDVADFMVKQQYQEESVVIDERILETDFVAYAENEQVEVCGCVALRGFVENRKAVVLDDLYVIDKCRRCGIARKLAYYAINTAHENGKNVELGILENNENGKAFWDDFFKHEALVTPCKIYSYYYIFS